jgi:hypothetical protein
MTITCFLTVQVCAAVSIIIQVHPFNVSINVHTGGLVGERGVGGRDREGSVVFYNIFGYLVHFCVLMSLFHIKTN